MFLSCSFKNKKKTKKISKIQASLKTRRKTQKNINSDSATSSSQNHVLNTTFLNVHYLLFSRHTLHTNTIFMRFVFMFLLLCPLWRDFLYVSILNICDTSSWTFLSPVDSLNYCVFLVAYYDGADFFF